MVNRFSITHWIVTLMALVGVIQPQAQAKQFTMNSMPVSSEFRTGPLLLACGGGGSGSYRKPAKPSHHRDESTEPAISKPVKSAQPSNF